MPKISTLDSKGLLIKYLLKIILSTVCSVMLLSSVISIIVLKLDLELTLVDKLSVIVVVISSIIISFISTTQFKNNYLLLSCLSVTPLAIFVFINFLVNNTSTIILIVKLIAIFITAIIVSLIKSARKRG